MCFAWVGCCSPHMMSLCVCCARAWAVWCGRTWLTEWWWWHLRATAKSRDSGNGRSLKHNTVWVWKNWTELKNEHSSSTSAVVYYATYCRLFFYFEQQVTIEICLLHFSFLLLMLISITVWLCFFGMNQNKIFLLSLVKFWFVLFV